MDKEYKTIDGELELKNMRSQMSMELMQDSTKEQFKKEKEAIGMSAIMASSSATTSSAPQGLMKAWEVEYSLNSSPSAPPELESIRAGPQDRLHILSPIQSDNDSSAAPGLRQRLESMGHHELVSIAIDMAQQLEHLSQPPDTKFFMDSVEMASSQFNSPNITGIEHLLKDGLLAFLLKFKKHMPQYPPQVVKFNKVNFSAQVLGAEQGYETVGSKCFKCLLPCFSKRQGIQKFTVLENCSGYLMPGTMTLVCGPPGCGKSSFHKALAGRLFIDDTTTLDGIVSYNGKDISDIQVRRIAAFIAQSDRHLPTLTVRETCAFANTCTSHYNKTEYNFADDPNLVREASWLKNENLPLEMTLHLLGLRGVMDTPIGNTTIRGVSGGERHRVTTAEMVSGTFLVYFLDEISTGLDSSAAYDIVSTFRTYARIKQYTCLFSLLQPSPEVFDLFDRIIVLNEGRIIFQGPRGDVLSYFKTLGYVKPNHVDVADFLQEVTTEEGIHFLLPEFRHLTSNEFVKAYMDSDMYKDVLRIVNNIQNVQELWLDVAKPLGLSIVNKPSKPGEKGIVVVDKVEASGMATAVNIQHTADVKEGDTIMAIGVVGEELEYLGLPTSTLDAFGIFGKVAEAPRNIILQLERPLEKEDEEAASVFKQEYVQEWWPSTKTVLQRQATLVLRNKSFVYARIVQLLILGLFTGTLFYQVPNTTLRSDMDLKKSLAFLAVMTLSLNTFSQIPVQLDERSVFEKQFAARFFRPNAYVLACTLSQVPFTLIEMLVYTPLIYWLTGLTPSNHGGHFILYILVVFIEAITFATLVRLLASFCRTKEAASGLAGISIIFFLLFSGFLITKNRVPDWWIWVYYISPLQWGVTALVCNEFLSDKYSQPCNDSISYCIGQPNLTVGQAYLSIYEFPTTFLQGYWVPVIVLTCYYCILTSLCFYAVGNIRHDEVKLPPATRLMQSSTSLKPSMRSLPSMNQDASKLTIIGNFMLPKFRFQRSGQTGSIEVVDISSELTFEPMILSFHQICYEVKIPGIKDPRILLSNVSGFSKPHTLTALMGSSGAGKTTLLDVLAGRKTTGRITGDILINGYPKVQETFARISGYVEQNDIHMPLITVKESLEFSSALRLPKGTHAARRQQFMQQVMDLLELNEIGDKLVGTIGDAGLSIEEAKRLTIGVELAANPSILFLDEPTSGLDSRAAQMVMRGIVNIVRSGRSVICTIHQPSRRIFLYFDQLLLLKRGGEVTYFGPTGENAQELLGYFHSLPGVRECPANQNPASYMLEITGAGIGHTAARDFSLDYERSSLARKNFEELERYRYGKGLLGKEPLTSGYAGSWSLMFRIVVMRQFRTYWRNIAYSFGRIMLVCILGLILGSTFWQIKYDTATGMVSRTGLVYIAVVMVAITNANNVIPQVNAERVVYYREQASNMYPVLLYSISWTLAEIPYLCFSTLLFCAICFTMCGVATNSGRAFFEFWVIFLEYAACITYFGIFLAMLTPTPQVATIIIPIIVNFWNMTSGFMIPKSKIPNFWIWLYWVNPTQYTINSLTAIAFYCDVELPSCSTCTLDPTTCPSCNCVRVKDEGNVLAWLIMQSGMSLNYNSRYKNMGALFGLNILFMVGCVLALKYMKYNRR